MPADEPNLFDIAAAIAARDAALARYDTNTVWQRAARFAIMDRAQQVLTFTTDDVWQALAEIGFGTPPEPRAMGAAMKAAQASGLIIPLQSWATSQRPEAHASPKRVWQSLIYTEDGAE